MFTISLKRSLATLAVTIGVLSAAGPAHAGMVHTGGGWDPTAAQRSPSPADPAGPQAR